jgi:hypothetical protein
MKVVANRNVFTYDELEPDAQTHAIHNLCEQAWVSLDSDLIAEDLNSHFVYLATGKCEGVVSRKELADKYGARIYWSVAYSQSDHATIEGKLYKSDTPNLAWPEGVTYARIHSTNYGHSRVECVETDDENLYHGPLFDATQEMITQLNSNLYRFARQQCEAYTDKDYVLNAYSECYEAVRRFTDEGDFADTAFWTDENGEGDK